MIPQVQGVKSAANSRPPPHKRLLKRRLRHARSRREDGPPQDRIRDRAPRGDADIGANHTSAHVGFGVDEDRRDDDDARAQRRLIRIIPASLEQVGVRLQERGGASTIQ